jgi:UDP-N-acetylglucosamine:LPS N-acetylglucosamine transferase
MEKRILILTAGFGEGHNAAARGVRDGLAAISGGTGEVELHDLFAESYGLVNEWTRKSYLTVINRAPQAWSQFYRWLDRREKFGPQFRWLSRARARLSELLLRFRPTAVFSVYPVYSYLLEAIFGASRPEFKQVICITDSITVNAIWFRGPGDLFLVPNDQTAKVILEAGVPNEKVRVSGFPVSPKFAELGELRDPPDAGSAFRLLHVINSGGQIVPELIRGLNRIPNLRLTITVGRDERLRQKAEALRAELQSEIEIIGWTDQLPRLMLESHLLLSKAGGATTQEAIAAKCPMIITQVVPGQEEGNARLIVETKSGAVASSADAIVTTVSRAMNDDARVWKEWSANIRALSRPRASLEIAELLLGL